MHDVAVCKEIERPWPSVITEFPGEISYVARLGENVSVQGDAAESDAREQREWSEIEGKRLVFLIVEFARVFGVGINLAVPVRSQLKRRSGEYRDDRAVID